VAPSTVTPDTTPPSSSIQPIPTQSGTLPTNIVNGSTVSLNCGTTYRGTLNLSGKSNVTVNTAGTCGRAVITPAMPVSGWSQYSGNIYVANVASQVSQVFADSQLMGEAHYPNSVSEDGWVEPTGTTADTISVSSLPNNDIVGARATFRSWDWQLGTRSVTAFNGTTITLAARGTPDGYADDTPPGKFYLEGKLWMLDTPGEWAWSGGKLYMWMPDGQAPGARVLAASNVDAVDATGSSNVTLNNVRIIGGNSGVNGSNASVLKVLNSEVAYSNDGISVKGANGIVVDNTDVTNIVRSGVDGGWWSTNATVNNSRVTNVNMIGMHKGSDGSIVFSDGTGAIVTNNTVTNGGKSGISVGNTNGSLVKGNTIDNACAIHADCGGIYAFARDQSPLNVRIENNKLNNITGITSGTWGPARYAIYLDDHSNAVTVTGNTVTNGYTGMQIHGGFNNTVSGNTFSGNTENHIFYSDSSMGEGSVFNNTISSNTFVGPVHAHYFYSEYGSNPAGMLNMSANIYQNYGSSPKGNAPLTYQ
jgi:parallel beta-helix repeat protein